MQLTTKSGRLGHQAQTVQSRLGAAQSHAKRLASELERPQRQWKKRLHQPMPVDAPPLPRKQWLHQRTLKDVEEASPDPYRSGTVHALQVHFIGDLVQTRKPQRRSNRRTHRVVRRRRCENQTFATQTGLYQGRLHQAGAQKHRRPQRAAETEVNRHQLWRRAPGFQHVAAS